MLHINNKKDCSGCSACFNICPVNAITMVEDVEGFEYPVINKEKCVKCGLCEKTCPCINNIKSVNIEKPLVYASWSLNRSNKLESSSGGLFYEFANAIFNENGVVVGAGFDKELNVIHKIIIKSEDLSELKGSKYVQSKIGAVYVKIKELLKEDRTVLFVGTPCQVAGLYSFLNNKNAEKLYTIDLICHGVPSPKVYRKYLKELSLKYNENPKKISFRNKTYGWKKFSMKVEFDTKTYIRDLGKDIFMRGFLSNMFLRPSCYECKFAKIPRIADLTLGDFWEIVNIAKSLDDDSGTSELIVNSLKGKQLLEKIQNKVFMKEVELEFGIKVNPCLVGSVKEPQDRKSFFKDLESYSLEKLGRKYFPKKSLVSRAYYKIKGKINRVWKV